MELLKANPDKINWDVISGNPSIFKIDYKQMYLDLYL